MHSRSDGTLFHPTLTVKTTEAEKGAINETDLVRAVAHGRRCGCRRLRRRRSCRREDRDDTAAPRGQTTGSARGTRDPLALRPRPRPAAAVTPQDRAAARAVGRHLLEPRTARARDAP